MKHLLAAVMLFPASVVSVYAQQAASPHRASISISVFHLLNPELHVTGEMRLGRRLSMAAMLGAGRVTDEGTTSTIWEAGGQFRCYLLGSFAHGMMVGADAGYVDVDTPIVNPTAYLVGTHAGGVLGYKFSTKRGFTAEAQIGPVYLWGESAETSEWQTLASVKVGWSF
jgi:hypothetical protein